MTIPVGAPGWFEAWSEEQRQATLEIAARKLRWLAFWSMASLLGAALAIVLLVTGYPVPEDPGLGLPEAPMVVAVVVFGVALIAMLLSTMGWMRVRAVFSGEVEARMLRGLRALTAVPSTLAMLLGLFGLLWVGIYPSLSLNSGGLDSITLVDAATAVVALLGACCGMASVWLWVKLRPVGPAAA
jgi:hypothetical protein